MTEILVTANDTPQDTKARATLILAGTTDVADLCKAMSTPNTHVIIAKGTYDLNAGVGPDGTRYLRPAAGCWIECQPGATFTAAKSPCRIEVLNEGVKITGFNGKGFIGIQNYANNFTCEDTWIEHSLDGKTYLPFGKMGGCTAAFMCWVRPGQTLHDITFRRCTAKMAYHHGYSLNISGAKEGAGFKSVLYEDCDAISCGSGQETSDGPNAVTGDRDWSCGFDSPDAGDAADIIFRRCTADNSWQDGFHLDGSWDGHRQRATGILFEDCTATNSGQRAGTIPSELYVSGFYASNATFRRCISQNSRHAAFLCKNEDANSVVLESCISSGDAYGLVLEYGCSGVKVTDLTCIGNTRRALQATATGANISMNILNFAGKEKPVLLGITERLEFVDAPSHAADLARYAAISRPFNGALNISVLQAASVNDLVEVNPPSRSAVNLSGVNALVMQTAAPENPDPVIATVVPPYTPTVQPPQTEAEIPTPTTTVVKETPDHIVVCFPDGTSQIFRKEVA